MTDPTGPADRPDAGSLVHVPNFRWYLCGHLVSVLGTQMQLAAVEWEIYQRTQSKFAIGLVGLVQFLPVVALVLVSGHVVDSFDRRRVLMVSTSVLAAAAGGLAWVSLTQADYRWIYACVLVTGIARAFHQPAKAALLPQLVPLSLFTHAVAWNSGCFHLASVIGPALGGILIGFFGSPALIYQLNVISLACLFVCLVMIRYARVARQRKALTVQDVMAGLSYLRRNQVVLGAIAMDMFAVLLGGAVALLPVYATDILQVGATGYGWLRAAPGIGALLMSIVLARRAAFSRAGLTLLWAVAGFGVVTIIFGLSRSFWLSLGMLFLSGVLDNVSVVIRHTLVQVLTPDHLRGRVSAINGLFIGASNELGAFESGTVAELFSPTISVVSGGLGTLLVVVLTATLLPALRCFGSLSDAGVSEASKTTP